MHDSQNDSSVTPVREQFLCCNMMS